MFTNYLDIKTQTVTFQKVNEKNEPLADAKFTVKAGDAKAQEYTTNDKGKFTIEVPEGTTNYTVTETEAPEGYQNPDGSFTFTAEWKKGTNKVEFSKQVNNEYQVQYGENLITVTNEEIRGSLTVTKQIDEFYAPHGDAVFFFNLTNVKTGRTYTKYVTFTSESQAGYGGQMGLSVTFTDLEMGEYVLDEENPIRYEFKSVIKESSMSNSGSKVTLTLVHSNPDQEVTYQNTKTYDRYFSDAQVVNNHFTVAPQK